MESIKLRHNVLSLRLIGFNATASGNSVKIEQILFSLPTCGEHLDIYRQMMQESFKNGKNQDLSEYMIFEG